MSSPHIDNSSPQPPNKITPFNLNDNNNNNNNNSNSNKSCGLSNLSNNNSNSNVDENHIFNSNTITNNNSTNNNNILYLKEKEKSLQELNDKFQEQQQNSKQVLNSPGSSTSTITPPQPPIPTTPISNSNSTTTTGPTVAYLGKRRSSLQINETSPKFIQTPSVDRTLCILDSLPCPVFQIGIVENSENGNITLNGFANERLTQLLSCSSNLLVDSLKSIPSPHYNTVSSLENSNSLPINNLAPGLLPTTDPSKILDPYISLYDKKHLLEQQQQEQFQQAQSQSQQSDEFSTTQISTSPSQQLASETTSQPQTPSMEQLLYDSSNSTGTNNSISRQNSILQCILDAFHEQKTICEKVLLSNFLIRQQYKSRATIKPFPDGCICIFEHIENINLNYEPPLNSNGNNNNNIGGGKFSIIQNEMELLSLSPDITQKCDSPFIHSLSNTSLSSMTSLQSGSSASSASSIPSSVATPNGSCITNGSSSKSSTSSISPSKYLNHKNGKIYSNLLTSFENLSFLLKSTPCIIWRSDQNGEMVFFKKLDEIPIDDKKCVGNSFTDFLQWVPNTYQSNFTEMYQNNLKTNKVFEFLYWFKTPQNYVQLYKIAGYPIFHTDNKQTVSSKKHLIGWLGVTFNYLINDGAEISIKGTANLDNMYEKFKQIYEMPNIERTKLNNNNINLTDPTTPNNINTVDCGSSESSKILLEKKKHLISEAEKECFLKCKETYNILFKLSLLGVMFSTFKGVILDANDMLLQTIGYTRNDLENGKIDWMLLTPPEHFEISARALQELKAKRWCQPIEKAYIHKSGKRVPVLITSAMIDGSTEQCITFVFDLSRYRQAELAAIEATRLKTQFITNISHELRTPCHGIVGMSQLLLDSQLTVGQRENIDSIKRSTDSLISLINDILDFSKLEYGKVTLENESFELLPMIEEVLDSQASLANSKGIDLIFVMGRDYPVPPVIFGDRNSLKKVLLNLVGNAVKFTETGFVLLEISTDYESGDQISLRFTVKDSGIGIPENKIEQIFIPFGQIDGSNSRKHGGSGLGLSFCKELVALMGGYIRVESGNNTNNIHNNVNGNGNNNSNGDDEDSDDSLIDCSNTLASNLTSTYGGKGTTFWFAIKVSISSPSYLPNSVPAANQFFYPEYKPSHYNSNGDSKNVLIIESNQLVVMSIQSILLSMKCDCINALNSTTALDLLESSKNTENQIDIIICSDKVTFVDQLLDYCTNNEKIILYGVDSESKYMSNQKIYSYLVTPITHSKLISSILRSKCLLKSKTSFLNGSASSSNINNVISATDSDDDNLLTTISPLSMCSSSNITPTNQSTSDILSNNNNANTAIAPAKKYILVAEDNDINIKVVVRQLEKLGYTAIVGINGLKALEMIGSVPICLILLDCQMPEMDGFTCSRIIRELEPQGQRIPIIAMTANDSKDKCFEVGMDDYLSKPVKVDRLQKTLSDWIKLDDNGNPLDSFNFYPSPTYSIVYNNFIENQLKVKNNDENNNY